jgi:hypothetical protein
MKTSFSTLLIGSLLPWTLCIAQSSPLLEVEDYLNIFFDGSSSLVWQSNIFYDDSTEKDETMLIISPGLAAELGSRASSFNAYIQANYELQRFAKRSRLNDDYFHFDAIASYENARYSINASYSFDEEQTTAGEQGASISESEFIGMDLTNAHLFVNYVLSPKFSFEPGVRYHDREYKDEKDRLADVESYSIPLDVFYELTPKVDLSFGYEYTFEEVGIYTVEDFHRELNYLNVGARGDLLSKLKGSFRVGYRSVNPEGSNRNSDKTLGIDTNVTYFATPKLTARLRLNRGFEVGSEGQSVEDTSMKWDFTYAISNNYSALFFTDWTYRQFKDGLDGKDLLHRTGLRLAYKLNQYWNFGSGYTYFENDSNRNGQGFVNHILDISAALRY